MNAGASDLKAGFETARALGAPVIVLFDDAIERVTAAGGRAWTISVTRCAA